ncbi:MAG TPA: aldo/keto reductase [Pseudonocardiaceae bacterium]|nr:aldo/keto reductase [Pseudonocardiaceae bacterium]
MTSVPLIRMNDGRTIPQFGFGVFQIRPADTAEAVRTALAAGYRHIDTAQMYRNEEGVGAGVRASGLPREDVFITTKLANDRHGYDDAISALDESLERLGTDYVDLYLIHWPRPKANRYVETWQAFEKLRADGRARSIGVSNFKAEHMARLDTTPAVNQIELHPALRQAELREYHERHGIVTEAWSPIAQGAVLNEPAVLRLAERHGKSAAQVVLRWHIQMDNVVFPKSTHADRIRENIDVFDFELTPDEMRAIDALDRGQRTGPDPDRFPPN